MISIIITVAKEPHLISRAIESILNQESLNEEYELIIAAPDKETSDVIKEYAKKCNQIIYFKDKGKGKVNALNSIFQKAKGSILILTDGDVYLDKCAVSELLKIFNDPQIGCVSGRPVSLNPRNNMLGYWSHFLYDVGAHKISRKKRFEKKQFLECSGYLFAFRNGLIKEIPDDVAEDSIIAYKFFKNGYRVGYAENAKVYVKSPTTFKDFLKQRKRAADSHTKLKKYEPDFPRVKSFLGEILEGGIKGAKDIWSYPKTPKEFIWTGLLFFVRLYIWLSLSYELKFKKRRYVDKWERVESTKAI